MTSQKRKRRKRIYNPKTRKYYRVATKSGRKLKRDRLSELGTVSRKLSNGHWQSDED